MIIEIIITNKHCRHKINFNSNVNIKFNIEYMRPNQFWNRDQIFIELISFMEHLSLKFPVENVRENFGSGFSFDLTSQ